MSFQAILAQLEQDPGDADALRLIARLLPDPVDAAAALGGALTRLLDEQRWDAAAVVNSEILMCDPGSPTPMEVTAPRLAAAQAWSSLDRVLADYAAALTRQASVDGGGNGSGWRALACWLELRDDSAGAAAAAAKALEINPLDCAAAQVAAVALARMAHPDASAAARRAAGLAEADPMGADPAVGVAMRRLAAECAEQSGDMAAALTDAERWASAAPGDADAHYCVARLCDRLGDAPRRAKALAQLIACPEPSVGVLSWAVSAFAVQGDWANADRQSFRLAALDPNWAALRRPIAGDRPGDMAALTDCVRAALDSPPPPPPQGARAPRRPWNARRAAFLVSLYDSEGAIFEGAQRQRDSAVHTGVSLTLHDAAPLRSGARSVAAVVAAIQATAPDVVLIDVDQYSLYSPLVEVASALRADGLCVVGLAYDLWGKTGRIIADGWGPQLDLLIAWTPNLILAEKGKQEGDVGPANLHILMAPMSPSHPEASHWMRRDLSCLFSGRLFADRGGWLAGAMTANGPRSLTVSLNGVGPQMDHDAYLAATRRARAILNLTRRKTGEKIVTGRAAEALACGSLLLEEAGSGVDWFYHEHRHYLSFGCMDELTLLRRFVDEQSSLASELALSGFTFFTQTYGPAAWWEMLAGAIASLDEGAAISDCAADGAARD